MKTELTDQEQNSFNENLFFRNIENANPNAQKLANELKNRNQTQDYLRQFALKYGYPIWDKSKILPAKLPGQSSNFSKEYDSVIIVPVLHPAIKEVRTYVEASIKDFTILAVHTANEYQKLKFGADEKQMIGEAERHAIRFMTLNMDIFNYTVFNISDKRLFHGSGDYKDTPLIQRTIKLYSKQPTATTNFSGAFGDNLYYHQVCVDIITTTPNYHCTNTGACAGGTCDNCDLCVSTSSSTTSICESWWDDGGGGSGGDPGGTTTGGTSGGGGTTGSTTCTGAGPLPVNGREMPCGNNEPGGWVPVEDPTINIVTINEVKNTINPNFPCLVGAFDAVTEQRLTNSLYHLYVETFVGENKVHNLEILSGRPLLDQDNNPVEAKSRVSPTDLNTYQIALNEDFGTEFTQEYWSSIILHELVHGFIQKNNLNFTPTTQFHSSHQTMLMNWVNDIKEALLDSYPNMTEQDALCLSIIGMSDMLTDDVNDTFRYEMTVWMEQHYNVNANLLGSTREAYRNGTRGIPCN